MPIKRSYQSLFVSCKRGLILIPNSAVVLGSKDKEGKKSKKRDTKEAADDSVSRKKKKKSLLYVLTLYFVCTLAFGALTLLVGLQKKHPVCKT